jgi:hypothetical protein
MRNILMVSFQFPPTGGAGVQRISKLVKYLPQNGWIPCILAINSSQSTDSPCDPSLLSKIPSEVIVHRMKMDMIGNNILKLTGWLKLRRWGRGITRAILFPDPSILWWRKAVHTGLKMIREYQVEAIYTTEPASAHWVGHELYKQTGIPWVMDIRDLWTQNFTYRPITYIHGILDNWLESKLIRSATAVNCVTNGFKQELLKIYGINEPHKYFVISNGYDDADYTHLTPRSNKRDKFTLTYVGTLYDFTIRPRPKNWRKFFEPLIPSNEPAEFVRTPHFILLAIKELLKDRPDIKDKLRVRFIGIMPPKIQNLIEELGMRDIVETMGYVPQSEAIKHMGEANVLIIMQAGKGSEVVVPAKLYEYFRSGRAILGLFPEGEAPALIRSTRSGVVLPPQDLESIKQQLLNWFELWEQGQPLNNPDWARIRTFSMENKVAEFAILLNQIANNIR